ncbi:spermatogenesis-associated protein 22 isoform X2 [Antennarius striatus]|uniref:spermatogenesis-associated protein 22 isoform X2 n=1 Tax=Antennarius striatus TaxID=241820 RepID=UPI0035B2A923
MQPAMRKQESQPAGPTTGFMPLRLFNQKKRSRIPLTSTPSENEFFSLSEYTADSSSDTYGCYQTSGSATGASESHLWNRPGIPPSTSPQQYNSSRPAQGPTPAMRRYSPMPHPYKVGGRGSKMVHPSNTVRKQESSMNSRDSEHQPHRVNEHVQGRSTAQSVFSRGNQQSSYKAPSPMHHSSQQSKPPLAPVPPPNRLPTPAAQSQDNPWNFTNSFGPQNPSVERKRSTDQCQTVQQTQKQEASPTRPTIDNSLRILTAVIHGIRHWSHFKDKVPYLFEIFGTLDSAVTMGHHGAKNFLMRDGKETVQCVFYENEQELPRLIRGQVHRCVGNYDRSKDVLVCVSVRPGLPSELRNAQESVKVCNAEMRALVKSFNEI